MTDIERTAYPSTQAAVDELVRISRRLEITRGCHARVEQIHWQLTALIERFVYQRQEALKAIDALTESAPSQDSPFVEAAGRALDTQVCALELEAMQVVEQCGGREL